MKKLYFFIFIFIFSIIGLVFFSFYCKKVQMPKDFLFIEEEMKPAIHFVKDYYEKKHSFPSEEDFFHNKLKCAGRIYIKEEYEKFKDSDYKDFSEEIVIPQGEYIICIWRGEGNALYYSYTNKIYANYVITDYN